MTSTALMNASYTLDSGQKLNYETVKNYLVSGDGNATDQEILLFIELCKAQRLNPFIREAYLIKFGKKQANIVVGKDVFVKRAHKNPRYEGMRSGIVTITKDGDVNEREGTLKLPGETLIGGWCEVYVRDHKFPIRSTVSLEEYSKEQATWRTMPCVMIRKCALVTALREAFPEDLAGLYDVSEMDRMPDKLPEKEVDTKGITPQQRGMIMGIAEDAGLYDTSNVKDVTKLTEFCDSNGYDLVNLTYDEGNEVIKLLSDYNKRKKGVVIDVDATEVNDAEEQKEEAEQISMDEVK
ncbi:phage recombination protein Bet [Peptostreptococcus sp.]|uniref:phage recombination protein Bet n=1 Tax=Peptostreptococcus sp. TaxID=1262 RepID=UPI001D7450B1|nr:phage recombination protein Bet [Peptostreptococcus sp.]MBS5595690.1 phage recombination protein Bet [Peptostreptococcus sp.]